MADRERMALEDLMNKIDRLRPSARRAVEELVERLVTEDETVERTSPVPE